MFESERGARQVRRLFEVLDRRLVGHIYLVGTCTIADIAIRVASVRKLPL
jgi:glutathione S-transferase